MSLFGITKVSEGFDASEADIPIDIHYNKLLDWLVDRKKISLAWKKQLKPIKDKIALAVEELPKDVDEIRSIVESNHELHYFHCLEILDLLQKNGEQSTKNFMGKFTSKRLQDWADICKMYEQNNLFLGETGHLLTSFTNYEIPTIKRNIEQCQKQLQDLNKKETEWLKSVQNYKTRFQQSCVELQIEGKDIRAELLGLVSQIPGLLEDVVVAAQEKEVKEAVGFYAEFVNYTLNLEEKSKSQPDLLPTLRQIISNGNEKLHKEEAPKGAVAEAASGSEKTEATPSIEIDWTIIDQPAVEPAVETAKTEEQPVIIEWDIGTVQEPAPSSEIVWDLGESVDTNVIDLVETADVSMEALSGVSESKPIIEETMLSNTNIRNKFVDNLLELQCFLHQRVQELEAKNSSNIDLFASAPNQIRNQTAESTGKLLSAVTKVIGLMEDDKMRRLFEIKNSKRFVDRTVAGLNHLLECADKSNDSVTYGQQRKKEIEKSMNDAFPLLEKVKAKTKKLKKDIELALSKQYSGRTVNLIGEISYL